jgi:hypothetical protein
MNEIKDLESSLEIIELTYSELVKFVETSPAAKVLSHINVLNQFVEKSVGQLSDILRIDKV